MTPTRRRLLLAAALACLVPPRLAAAQQTAPVVAAASDLQFALTEIAAAFTRDTGQSVRLSFGSTGNFARQIRAGAPFELFLAADESFVADLDTEGLTEDAGDLYALGRIVLIAPKGSALTPDPRMDDLARMLAEGRITRFAIANPDHAPYGLRAREALMARGLWDDIRPALVLGENVSQAAQFALSGDAAGGIIALSLALAPELAERGEFALIPQDLHAPLRQRMVLLKDAGEVARAFHAYLQGAEARTVMTRHGFELPEG
ncbi:molybdate ABC transporter substrate-binding protein [Paracoccus liaowanqingii]|uniref:Molybdate ABC transporter substrate-binding protein n=1 Tax=Paracoccus liaowanqingii TaxID=2560053 RepID=A0A4P7HM26_9RHOB|nr:molybdate ABC transporter substrate-binding protein [Paracoccus liaowanqingii]QBX35299.1 molybdate ABC transporter substrate-binding protein [Paracoccus liaowanqingii]